MVSMDRGVTCTVTATHDGPGDCAASALVREQATAAGYSGC